MPSENPNWFGQGSDSQNSFLQQIIKVSQERAKANADRPKVQRKMLWWKKLLVILILTLAVVGFAFYVLSFTLTDYFWFEQAGYAQVFLKQLLIPAGLFIAGFIVTALVVILSLSVAYAKRPTYSALDDQRIRSVVDSIKKYHKPLFGAVGALAGVVGGMNLAANWTQILLMFNGEEFGYADPQFGLDASFYVFLLPGLQVIVNMLNVLVWFCLICCFLIHLSVGAIRRIGIDPNSTSIRKTRLSIFGQNRRATSRISISTPAKIQMVVFGAIISIATAAGIFLQRYNTLTEVGDRITGAAYTSTHAFIPGNTVLAVLALVVGVSCIVTIFLQKWTIPLFAIGGFMVASILCTAVIPYIVQKFVVEPNAQTLESEYIQRNIEATDYSFGLDKVEIIDYNAKTQASADEVRKDAETTAQIRLLDPQVVSPTFRQIQQNKQYYNFVDTLAVDKYNLNGESRDTVIAAREINLAGNDQRNWVNDHTVFTHGYGLVAAYGNQVTVDGNPKFFEKDIPTVGDLTSEYKYEPRIYFSPNAPNYSIVGNSGSENWEFDYPSDSSGTGAVTTFTGSGGPTINNIFTQMMYTIRFGDTQLLFSERVTPESQALFYRDPSQRVENVAPYLTLDGRVYPAVVDGRVKWIVDAYTTSENFPYSQKIDLQDATQDSLTRTSKTNQALESGAANYVRNSIKATVDAYDGTVDLYAWDENDPILKAWTKIFNNTVKPLSEISGELMSHIRYPESMFKVQRSLLAKYHVNDASQFFSGEDFWHVPDDPTKGTATSVDEYGQEYTSAQKQPPYYLTLEMPGDEKPIFSLSTGFIPGGESRREILTGFLAASSDAGNQAGVIGPDYGKLRLLELPKNSTVPGPGQAQNNFNSNAQVSQALNLLQTGSSDITRGNLLTLPIAGGLVYVQPVYVQSSGNTSFPLMKKVLVSFGDTIGFADTLTEAMDQVFVGG
ncbi:MAG: UPF0182 family protein, partial [Bifidobacteriaceae bacterium]|nr:UPF0182 family protein [Bifidobacteriaceae bacterium]